VLEAEVKTIVEAAIIASIPMALDLPLFDSKKNKGKSVAPNVPAKSECSNGP
jgi:hypothetical protein